MLLTASAKFKDVKLTGHMHSCEGCLAARGIEKAISKRMVTRSDKKLGFLFVDLGGPKKSIGMGGTLYRMIFRDGFLRSVWIYIPKRSETPQNLRMILAYINTMVR